MSKHRKQQQDFQGGVTPEHADTASGTQAMQSIGDAVAPAQRPGSSGANDVDVKVLVGKLKRHNAAVGVKCKAGKASKKLKTASEA